MIMRNCCEAARGWPVKTRTESRLDHDDQMTDKWYTSATIQADVSVIRGNRVSAALESTSSSTWQQLGTFDGTSEQRAAARVES